MGYNFAAVAAEVGYNPVAATAGAGAEYYPAAVFGAADHRALRMPGKTLLRQKSCFHIYHKKYNTFLLSILTIIIQY